MQTEQLPCWSGMTDTEHSTISSSNEDRWQKKHKNNRKQQLLRFGLVYVNNFRLTPFITSVDHIWTLLNHFNITEISYSFLECRSKFTVF